jgi:arylsulfatase A-like enzyme
LNCFERAGFSKIKGSMKLFNHFCAAIFLSAALPFFAAAQTNWYSVFSNVALAAPTVLPRRTSIIFIQCDGLGYGDLSCYGQTKFQTPNLDKLAAGGIRFTNYSIANAGPVSHASLMLGKNPEHLRQHKGRAVPLAQNETTIAEVLKNSGYHTCLIGDWDLGDENSSGAPWKKGFDEFAGYLNSADAGNFYADYIFRHEPPMFSNAANSQGEQLAGKEMVYLNTGGQRRQYIPDLLTKAALNFVKNNQPDQFNRYKPFFLLLNYEIPNGKIEVPTDAPFSEEAWPQPEKNKAAFISRLDGYVGKLREQLEKSGMTNNVVIFFSSGGRPEKGAETDPDFFRSNVSSNNFRVPMIAYWPGRIPAGQISGLKTSPQDFLPTATEIGFAKPPEKIDGVSLLPAMSEMKN